MQHKPCTRCGTPTLRPALLSKEAAEGEAKTILALKNDGDPYAVSPTPVYVARNLAMVARQLKSYCEDCRLSITRQVLRA